MVESAFIFFIFLVSLSMMKVTGRMCGAAVECCSLLAICRVLYLYIFYDLFTSVDINRSGPECHLTACADVQNMLNKPNGDFKGTIT